MNEGRKRTDITDAIATELTTSQCFLCPITNATHLVSAPVLTLYRIKVLMTDSVLRSHEFMIELR